MKQDNHFVMLLSEKVLTQKRRYTKFTEVLRDVGGLTVVVLSIIYIIIFFSSKVSYDLSLVNNLFEFNTDKKLILIHDKYQNKNPITVFQEIEPPFWRKKMGRL